MAFGAGTAARRVCLPLNVTTPIVYYYSLVRRIQKRLVAILLALPTRGKVIKMKVDRPPKADFDELMLNSSHCAFIDPDNLCRIRCARCHSTFNVKDPAARTWLSSPCPQLGSAHDRPVILPYESMRIGNRVSSTLLT